MAPIIIREGTATSRVDPIGIDEFKVCFVLVYFRSGWSRRARARNKGEASGLTRVGIEAWWMDGKEIKGSRSQTCSKEGKEKKDERH